MAINVNFHGATIYKPGAYSQTQIDTSGAFPLSPTGLVGILGESTRGKPGSEETDIIRNVFTPDQMAEILDKYGAGPIVDACTFLFAPANDGAVTGGAQAVFIYKTNASTRANLDITRAVAGDYGVIRALQAGEEGNRITYMNTLVPEVAPVITASTSYVAGAINAGISFTVYLNGVKQVVTVPTGTYATAAAAAAAITITGVTVSASVNNIVFTVNSDAAAHTKGYGKSLILQDSTLGDLAKIGMVAGIATSTIESASTIKIEHKKFVIDELDTIGGNVVLKGGYIGSNATASIQISEDKITLVDAASTEYKFSSYPTIKDMIEDMNLETDWVFELADILYGQLPASIVDKVASVGAKTFSASYLPVRIKKDYYDFKSMMDDSGIIEHVEADTQLMFGLPPAQVETRLSTEVGTLGATQPTDVVNGLLAFESVRINAIVPLFSRNATDDIADGLTDSQSTYTIDGIHQAVKLHVAKMGQIKQKSERQAYLSFKSDFISCLEKAADLADFRTQLVIQDVRNIDAQGSIKWFQPWAAACNLAGARMGSSIGLPMTSKYMNLSGIRHTDQAMRTAEANIVTDFDPRTQYEQAIKGGITFMENPQTGGFRWVVDNTTYGKDGNWFYNRGNVLYAGDVAAYDFRNQIEAIYIGTKNTVSAAEIKSTCESILVNFLSQGITVSTSDAPNGFKSLSVRLVGNTIFISVVLKLVEGIDFALIDFKVQRAVNEA